ncbi:MAG TPA: hypothetical protein VJJ23_06345 [Candidatus Nanoarchaeia archaeon]|nr:hypothetical protein [Candidatus Nanoarchaeia archaeon]
MQISFDTKNEGTDQLKEILNLILKEIKERDPTFAAGIQQSPQIKQISVSDVLKQDKMIGLGVQPQQRQVTAPLSSEADAVKRVNEEFKEQYYEKRQNPDKPKKQNPQVDMSALFYGR